MKSKFGGSSKFKVIEGELVDEAKKQSEKQIEKRTNKQAENSKNRSTKTTTKNENKKSYKLNKSKIKKKCHAFARLGKSRNFLAFYSISFPVGLTDEVAYKIFNTWLTRSRRNCGLKSYLWVAERQKNKTIHFHLLTNDFMPIKTVNGFMAAALLTEKKKGNKVLKEVETDKYNGVDVKKVGGNRRGLISYLAKYISKNEVQFYRLPWHCSRDVSRLFTSYLMDDNEEDKFFDMLPRELDKYTEILEHDYFRATGFKFNPDSEVFEEIDDLNEMIYNEQ
ncbi:rolling circle replication-associated protein [Sunxiuqinia elliptica]|uniref:rolling circle replication-associated protein n=1 Tax=Sunxiuqinia elliptica TaxID=655355 RepID=UPI001113F6FC|nr:hypothetical protein [Sunxiuqinia elliptica]